MSDLFEDESPRGPSNAPEFSVSELSGAVKKMIEGEFGHVRVRAEVGRVTRPRSGHLYFDLKDDRSVLNCVSWKGQVARMEVLPEEGMEVIATGRMTTFPGGSRYQLIVDNVEPAGAGALMAMLEKRKKELAAEGLFDADRKQPLPFLPRVIGVVTSPSGAVIRDILHRLRDRFPRHVLIWPVAVQGQSSAAEVANGIRGFNALQPGGAIPRPDLIIVARGGGSVEDLWGFNEEIVVRAAAESQIPLISAVGHETDTTLIDFASDRRAPTPTAAAEMAVPVRRELWVAIQDMRGRMEHVLSQRIEWRKQSLRDLSRAIPQKERLLDGPRQRFDQADARLDQALRNGVHARKLKLSEAAAGLRPGLLTSRLDRRRDALRSMSGRLDPIRLSQRVDMARERFTALETRLGRAATSLEQTRTQRLERTAGLLEALSYHATLERGYAVVRDAKDGVVMRASDANRIHEIEFADGRVAVSSGTAPKKSGKAKADGPDQGSLF